VPDFVGETAGAQDLAQQIARVVADDLTGTGLFREVPREAHISEITSFGSPVQFADWKAINAQALITRLSAASTAPGPLRRSTFFTSNTVVLLLRRGNPRASETAGYPSAARRSSAAS